MKNSKEESTFLESLGGMFYALISMLLILWLKVTVIVKLWEWFVITSFYNVDPLTKLQVVGLLMLLLIIKNRVNLNDIKDTTFIQKVIVDFFQIGLIGLLYLIGYIAHINM